MKKHLIVIGITLVLLIVGLSGCEENTSKSDEDKIIGTWVSSELYQGKTNISITFLSNKTFKTVGTSPDKTIIGNGTWKIVDNKLVIDITEPTVSSSISDYHFSNNFNTLTITDSTGTSMGFIKQ